MKNYMLIVVGLIIVIIIAVCPLPMMFGISGLVWRIIIGLIGCFSFALGVYKKSKKKGGFWHDSGYSCRLS